MTIKFICTALLFSVFAWQCAAAQPEGSYCGAPLLAARAGAFPPQGSIKTGPDGAGEYFALLSKANTAELRAALGRTTQEDDRATTLFTAHTPYVTRRIPFAELRAALAAGALLSPAEKARQSATSAQPATTPQDALYDAKDCVSLTVGPAEGNPADGDVIIRLNPFGNFAAWATQDKPEPFLEMHKNSSATDTALSYTRTLVVRQEWQEFMSLTALSAMRTQPDEQRKRGIDSLVGQLGPENFWRLAAASYFGVLQAQVDTSLSLEYADSIEIPAGKLQEVLAWPQAAKWHGKLKEAP